MTGGESDLFAFSKLAGRSCLLRPAQTAVSQRVSYVCEFTASVNLPEASRASGIPKVHVKARKVCGKFVWTGTDLQEDERGM